MLPTIPDDSKRSSRLRVNRNRISSATCSVETSNNHISAIGAVIASVAGTCRLVSKAKTCRLVSQTKTCRSVSQAKRARNIQHHFTDATLAPPQSLTTDSDTINTLARHNAAIEKLKNCLNYRRDDWRSFGYPSLHTWPEQADLSGLRHEVEKVLDAKRQSIRNTTAVSKSKTVIKCIYDALTPFLKNFLTVARNVQSVYSRVAILC